jgi:hypothetical protein
MMNIQAIEATNPVNQIFMFFIYRYFQKRYIFLNIFVKTIKHKLSAT